jgi:hypothetical protein
LIKEFLIQMEIREKMKAQKKFDEICETYARAVLKKRVTISELRKIFDPGLTSTAVKLDGSPETGRMEPTPGGQPTTDKAGSKKPSSSVIITAGELHAKN